MVDGRRIPGGKKQPFTKVGQITNTLEESGVSVTKSTINSVLLIKDNF